MKSKLSSKTEADQLEEDKERWAHWWKESVICARDQFGLCSAKPNAHFWFAHFWEPRRRSAWMYELVRRLAKHPRIRNPQLTKRDRSLVSKMPSYIRLTVDQKEILFAAYLVEFEHTDQELEGEIWHTGQPDKLGDWTQIEALDEPYSLDKKEKRDNAKSYFKRFWPFIAAAYYLISTKKRPHVFNLAPPYHELTNCFFRDSEFKAAIQAIKGRPAQIPANRRRLKTPNSK